MAKIQYVKGDATQPEGEGARCIVHSCNDQGGWGKGFSGALSQRWTYPEVIYRRAFAAKSRPQLGEVLLVVVEPDLQVANLIAQAGYRRPGNLVPLSYAGLEKALGTLTSLFEHSINPTTFHMPRIGCGLGGGDWNAVSAIIERTLCKAGFEVTVYDQ